MSSPSGPKHGPLQGPLLEGTTPHACFPLRVQYALEASASSLLFCALMSVAAVQSLDAERPYQLSRYLSQIQLVCAGQVGASIRCHFSFGATLHSRTQCESVELLICLYLTMTQSDEEPVSAALLLDAADSVSSLSSILRPRLTAA